MHGVPPDPEVAGDELSRLRDRIEALDREIVALVAQRVRLAREVGTVKRAAGLPPRDAAREQAVLERTAELARAQGLPEADMRRLFTHLIEISRHAQQASD